MKTKSMTFYVKPWQKEYPINEETIKMFAYAKISCFNLATRRVEISFEGIGTYVNDKF